MVGFDIVTFGRRHPIVFVGSMCFQVFLLLYLLN